MNDPQTRAVYALLSEGRDPLAEREANFPEVEFYYDPQHRAAVFRIPSFAAAQASLDRDKTLLADRLASLGDAPVEHIIFDITGNGGGNDLYWMQNIVEPFGGEYHYRRVFYFRDTPLTRRFYSDSELITPEQLDAAPEYVRQMQLGRISISENTLSGVPALSDEALAAKRWVLMDGGCYSSASNFIDFCKRTGWAVLVGEKNRGGAGVNSAEVKLENTGLLLRFDCDVLENTEGLPETICSISPDIPAVRQPPLEACFAQIEKEEEGA